MDAGKRAGKFERACLRERRFGFVEIVCLYGCSVTDTASSLFRAAERPGLARVREFAGLYEVPAVPANWSTGRKCLP